MALLKLGTVNRSDRLILTQVGYRDKEVCKSIPGARAKYNGTGAWKTFEFWHYPVDLGVFKLIGMAFPDIEVQPEAKAWARKEAAHRKLLRFYHRGHWSKPIQLKRVPTHAPKIWEAMLNRGYQTMVPAFAAKVGPHFNADQPGLGKTIEELGALVECGITGKILVMAPRNALRATWAPQIRMWLIPSKFKVNITFADAEKGMGDEREEVLAKFIKRPCAKNELQFLLINPEMVRWEFTCYGDIDGKNLCKNGNSHNCDWRKGHTKTARHPALFQYQWDAILMDETHKIMMNANERSGSVSQIGYGMQQLPDKGYRVGMSGTPFKGKPRRFWPVLHWLRPDIYTGQGKWQEVHFQTEKSDYTYSGKRITESIRPDREKLLNEELDCIMIRRTKRELHQINPQWAPPVKQYVIVPLQMSPKQRRAYEQMRDDAEVRLDSGYLMANGLLAEMTRLKQFACGYGRLEKGREGERPTFHPALPNCKWDYIKDVFLPERGILDGDGSIKVVIASQYVEMLKLYSQLLDRLRVKHFLVTGGMRDAKRVQTVWQSKQTHTRVLLLSTKAGTSFNFDAADDMVINDETGVPDDEEQAEDRVHRTSRTDHQVTVYRLMTEGTIDEILITDADIKDETQKRLLDGRRGVEYMKEILGSA